MCTSVGSISLQASIASGQRGWNRHPVGMSTGFGVSPLRITCSRLASGSGTGMTLISAFVYGCLGFADDLLGVADLDDAPEVHHGDAVADDPGEREVVGDEDVGDAELLLLLDHQLEDVVADRDVEARHRLVGDDHVGLEHGRAGDADALPLPAGELVRVAVQVLGRPAAAPPR